MGIANMASPLSGPKDDLAIGREELESSSATTTERLTLHQKPPFFRSTMFQILVVGLCAFCAPGIWSAMNGLGVGGSQSPNLVNAANALLYAFMTVTCFAGPWMTNLIGFRWTLAIGSLGYPLYAAGLYTDNRFGVTWFVYVGAVACGISAGFFWSVEGMLGVLIFSITVRPSIFYLSTMTLGPCNISKIEFEGGKLLATFRITNNLSISILRWELSEPTASSTFRIGIAMHWQSLCIIGYVGNRALTDL